MKKAIILIVILIFLACNNEVKEQVVNEIETPSLEMMFKKIKTKESGIDFKNKISETESFNFLQYEYLYNGAGVSIGDINNDGLLDIYFSGNMVSDCLYINKGDFKFEDITESSGIGKAKGFKTGVNMIDINNDGLLDIYVCRSVVSNPDIRRNLLYINNGDLTFSEKSEKYGLDDPGYSVQSYFFDADADGILEAFVLNHPNDMKDANNINVRKNKNGELELVKEEEYNYVADKYYVKKSGKYQDMTEKAGLLDVSFGLSAVVSDFNNDGLTDIFIANDYIKPDRLWINKGNHSFEDQSELFFKHTSFSSMGSDYADINNDGKYDLMVLDMLASNPYRRHTLKMTQNMKIFRIMQKVGLQNQLSKNVLQVNQYPNPFIDIANMAEVSSTDWSWNILMADFDNNSHKDIHITNGYYRNITNLDYMNYKIDKLQTQLKEGKISMLDWLDEIPSEPTRNFFFKNLGGLNLEDASKQWNAQTTFSNGAAYGDLNNDGYLDLVVSNINAAPHILKNLMKQKDHNYLAVELFDPEHKPIINTSATVYLKDGRQLVENLNPQRGFLSSSQPRLHFGLGHTKVDSLVINWPDKTLQKLIKPQINTILKISKNSTQKQITSKHKEQTIFVKSDFKSPRHVENSYDEYDHERLIDRSYSDLGPAHLVFDFNNDGREDYLLGGAKGYPTRLMTQVNAGKFVELTIPDFINDQNFEDTVAACLDFNNDGFLDIILGSASNEDSLSIENYPLRLYVFNPSKDIFERKEFNNVFVSTTSILIEDFDGDGIEDIFIGARNHPKYYPDAPKSYVLKGTDNGFVDATQDWFKDPYFGMVTDAKYEDLDNDGKKELIVIGEWMSPKVFEFNDGFKNVTEDYGMSNLTGLWENMHIEDLNGDGYKDIILANRGVDNLYRATKDNPLKMFFGDFDENYTNEYLLFQYEKDSTYKPLLGLDRISSQIPSFKRRFNSFQSFAKADWSFILDNKNLKNYEVKYLEHLVLLNQKSKNFKMTTLPRSIQNSNLKDIISIKNNSEEKIFILAGNHFNTDAEFSLYDSSNGHVMKWNNDKDEFEVIPYFKTGFLADKNARGLEKVNIKDETHIFIINNDDELQRYQLNPYFK